MWKRPKRGQLLPFYLKMFQLETKPSIYRIRYGYVNQ
ncbi:Uncharacterised protein [Klebsiella pneumoniae]|nr:Uncharacterised protein [Klebsiella pneumoniae]